MQKPPPLPGTEIPDCPNTPQWQPLTVPLIPDQVLNYWNWAQTYVQQWKDFEMKLRKLVIMTHFSGVDIKEGMNNLPLADGSTLKYTHKLSRDLNKPEGYTKIDKTPAKDKVDAVVDVMKRMAMISPNRGAFIAEEMFTFNVSISKTQLDRLEDDAKSDPVAAEMLKCVETVLTIKEASPSLEIRQPRGK